MNTRRNSDDDKAHDAANDSEIQAKGEKPSSKKATKASKESVIEDETGNDSENPLIVGTSDQSPASLPVISSVAKLVVAVAATAVLGVTAGLGIVLVGQSETLPNVNSPAPTASVSSVPETANSQETLEATSFDDALRDWNLKAAGSISPLISQLARAPRNTLGGQVALCQEQRAFLEAVLDLPTPPNKAVSTPFERWREAVLKTLDSCTSRTPSGSDADDIARIVRELKESEAYFASFLAAQQPFLDVQFQSNPEAFEK
jgi:hypothetical protein